MKGGSREGIPALGGAGSVSREAHENTVAAYNAIAQKYSSDHFEQLWGEDFHFFASMVGGKKVVDLGCGAGRDAAAFASQGFDYTGVDASEAMLGIARDRVPRATFRLLDFRETDFPNATFDGFWASASFLHIPKRHVGAALREAIRITKPGGVGFIAVKQKAEIDEGLLDERGVRRYFSFYMEDELRSLLHDHGLELIRLNTRVEADHRATRWFCCFVRTPP